jgi:D-alanyl-D-alanine carboxypeptidase
MRRSSFQAAIPALLLAACAVKAPPPANPPATQATSASVAPTPAAIGALDGAAFDTLLNQWMKPGNGLCDAPGAVLMVDAPAGRYLKAAGAADVDAARPMAVDDRLQIGSNTKAFTVILALQLQEQGVLSLDDPLSKWLPELAARIPDGERVTLRQMAGNTSGIWDYADPLMQPVIDANDQAALAKTYAPQELVEYAIANGKPDFAPGEGWHYSSTNFILLGLAVEAATGKSLAELYQERIFDPLGMARTSYLQGSPEPGSGAEGYYTVAGERVNMTRWNATQGGAAGAIVSTAEDMARFADGLFEGRLFQDDATLQEMLAFRQLGVNEGGGIFAGYGLGLISFGAPGFSAYGHAGQTPGFQSVWFRVPEADATLIFLTNSGSCRVTFLPSSLTPAMFGLPPAGAASEGELMKAQTHPAGGKPATVTALEAAYGAPSQAGFGSAVFHEEIKTGDSLEQAALAKYKFFVGDLWSRYGEDAWMGPWKEVYAREPGAKPDIVGELRGIKDRDAAISVPMILDAIGGAEKARAALASVYDDPAVTELRVYNLGDGGAMSGLLLAGRSGNAQDATFLVFLLD